MSEVQAFAPSAGPRRNGGSSRLYQGTLAQQCKLHDRKIMQELTSSILLSPTSAYALQDHFQAAEQAAQAGRAPGCPADSTADNRTKRNRSAPAHVPEAPPPDSITDARPPKQSFVVRKDDGTILLSLARKHRVEGR